MRHLKTVSNKVLAKFIMSNSGAQTQPWTATVTAEELYFRDAQLSQALNEGMPEAHLEHLMASLKSVPELSAIFLTEGQRVASLDEINADEGLRGALQALIRNGGVFLQAFLAQELQEARSGVSGVVPAPDWFDQ